MADFFSPFLSPFQLLFVNLQLVCSTKIWKRAEEMGRSATIQMLRDTPALAAEIEARVRNIGVVIPATGESEEENTPFDPD